MYVVFYKEKYGLRATKNSIYLSITKYLFIFHLKYLLKYFSEKMTALQIYMTFCMYEMNLKLLKLLPFLSNFGQSVMGMIYLLVQHLNGGQIQNINFRGVEKKLPFGSSCYFVSPDLFCYLYLQAPF